jgi:hypothetical protein
MENRVQELETQLDDFDPRVRRQALEQLAQAAEEGAIHLPEPGRRINLHAHTFFSFNGYGYSPCKFAWKARREGLLAGGIVDFDVLDGVDEFLEAGDVLNLRSCAGLETRVFVPELAESEINSPGEPGVAYYMGAGFTSRGAADESVLAELKATAQRRNRSVIDRVNPHLSPVEIDYEQDAAPLTPRGNVTERHLCAAYAQKAEEVFPDAEERLRFWSEKLGVEKDAVRKAMQSAPALQGLVRSKTMKKGGVGYIAGKGSDFPQLGKVRRFAAEAGAIPTYCFLDGTSDGESDFERLLNVMTAAGTEAVNIIPDRNWNINDPAERQKKVALFHGFVEAARERGLPIFVGTEMNAHGQRFVDDFDAPEIAAVADEFIRGAYILWGHTLLQRHVGMGYCSDWALQTFESRDDRNDFFAEVGQRSTPASAAALNNIGEPCSAKAVLSALE